jgi:hypothetical protein
MANLYTPGLVDFPELTLTNTDGSQTENISNIIAELSYYEDIFSPAISCSVLLVDAISLQDSLPIAGGEVLKLRLRAKGDDADDAEIEVKLQVYKTSDTFYYNEKTLAYSIFSTTEELLTNEASDRLIREGTKNFTIHETVKNIFENNISKVSNKELVTVEETEGIFNHTFPSVNPFRAMNIMCSEAKSTKNISSNFVFFETDKGYHFVTLQQLFEKKPIETYIYIEEINGMQRKSDLSSVKDYQKIIAVENVDDFNLLKSAQKGTYSGITKTLDVLAKSFFSKIYDYSKDFKLVNNEKTDNRTLTKESIKKFTSSPTKESFVTTNSKVSQLSYVKGFQPEMEQSFRRMQDFEAIETAATEQLLSQKINVMIHGNPRLHAGDTVNLTFPEASVTEKGKRRTNDSTSGKYLITAVVHRVNVTHKYTTLIECVKDTQLSQPIGDEI